ncbi:hypothetical protein [Paraburkholderia caribensis]|uniref:hypothetical protein n=1 Tax=Paraburkholderia caribensis TaxID=75105 RepID=UPI000ABDFA09|nr:hypothetical protein [Paraburkholderia caribensis]
MSDKFDQFVKKQVESSKSGGGQIDLEKEKSMWLQKLDQLYSLIEDGLSDYIKDGSIRLSFVETTLTEDLLGTYAVREAHITIGTQSVKLRPLGTFLIGARGRVDMTGPRGITRFTIVPPDATAPRVRVTVLSPGQTPPQQEAVAPPETWVWKIATPPPRITYIDLTPETFREALIGVVNG